MNRQTNTTAATKYSINPKHSRLLYFAAAKDLGMLRGRITQKLSTAAQTTYPVAEVDISKGNFTWSVFSMAIGIRSFKITRYAITNPS